MHYVFLDAATLTEVFPCYFLGCKANSRVILAKTEHGLHSSKIVVLFYVLFVFYCSMYFLCVNLYCHRVTTQLQLTNISYHICLKFTSKHLKCPYMFRSLDHLQGARIVPVKSYAATSLINTTTYSPF